MRWASPSPSAFNEVSFIVLCVCFSQPLMVVSYSIIEFDDARKIQEHENELKDKRRSEEELGISEDETRNSEAEKTLIQNALKSDQFGALVHHLSLVRNKRCLMAYV